MADEHTDTQDVSRKGQLAAAISNAVVGELSSTTGRGPTQAKTTFGSNAVFVVLQDTLTRGELTLVGAGGECGGPRASTPLAERDARVVQ